MRIDSDLTFSVEEPATAGLAGRSISGTVRADGSHNEVVVDDVPAVSVRRAAPLLRRMGAGLADRGLTLSVREPDGVLVTLGDVRSRVTDRSSLGLVMSGAQPAEGAAAGPSAASLDDAAAAVRPHVLPLAPTFRRLPRRITITHDPLGGGSPRLFFAAESRLGLATLVFYLVEGTTSIGSSPEPDLILEGLRHLQAEISRNDDEELGYQRPQRTPRYRPVDECRRSRR